MKALSIRQPWAWLIVRPDIRDPAERARAMSDGRIKTIENRDWRSHYRGPILIHAGKGMTRAEYEDADDSAWAIRGGIQLPPIKELERGGIVGQARLVDCVTESDSPWFCGRYGFVLADIANSTASWAKGQLAIIADMLAEEPPTTGRIEYIVDEIRRIADGIELIGGVDQ